MKEVLDESEQGLDFVQGAFQIRSGEACGQTSRQPEEQRLRMPYVEGFSERLRRALNAAGVTTAFKLQNTEIPCLRIKPSWNNNLV